MPAFFLLSAPRATTMPVLFIASGTASPQHASRSPRGLHLLPGPRHKRPSSPNGGVQSWAVSSFLLATTFRNTLREAFLINPCFFFMAGDMATWQHNRLSTDERCGASKAADSVRIKPALRGRNRAITAPLPRLGGRRKIVVGAAPALFKASPNLKTLKT